MLHKLRLALLVLALVLASPAIAPARAGAAELAPGVDVKIPKALVDWLKKNGPALYIVVDEILDDVFGGCCGGCCPPPPMPMDPPPPW
jgi:hypothetical protein